MRFLPRDNKIYLAEDGVTEVKGPGYQDKRNFLVTIIDPFDLGGIFRGRNMNQRFWETHDVGRREEVEAQPMAVKGNGIDASVAATNAG